VKKLPIKCIQLWKDEYDFIEPIELKRKAISVLTKEITDK